MKEICSILFVVGFFTMLIWHPYPWNTEVVCYKDGELVFYASGYEPSRDTHPLKHMGEDYYKVKATGEEFQAECGSSWGASEPRGRAYYE